MQIALIGFFIFDASPWWHKSEWDIVFITLAYTLISLATLTIITWQTWLAKTQIDLIKSGEEVTKQSARAAAEIAQTLIRAQRPFIMIEARGEVTPEFWAVNYGNSPAQIIFSNPYPKMGTFKEDELPENLQYGVGYDNPSAEQFNVPWIPPKGEYSLGQVDPNYLTYLSEQVVAELNNGIRVLVAYSAFKYRGLDGQATYTSTFCYRRYPGGYRLWGNYGWNTNT